jgi:hypothetical protein
LSSVSVSVRAPLLARGIELVDTPGTGSVFGHNTGEAEAALRTMDAALFVLTADPPVSASERELIAEVATLSVTMFVVLNKADRLSWDDLAEVLEFTAEVTDRAAGRPVRIYPMSARDALEGTGDAGFEAFAADFIAYLDHGRTADLRRAVAGHARRLACALRDEVLVERKAAELHGQQAAERVRAFAARLAAVAERRHDAADLAAAESRRMLAERQGRPASAAPARPPRPATTAPAGSPPPGRCPGPAPARRYLRIQGSLIAAARYDHRHRGLTVGPQQERQAIQRRRVRPLHVLDQHADRSAVCHFLQHLRYRGKQGPALSPRVCRPVPARQHPVLVPAARPLPAYTAAPTPALPPPAQPSRAYSASRSSL